MPLHSIKRSFMLLTLFAICLSGINCSDFNWFKPVSSANIRSSFPAGTLAVGQVISGSVVVPGTPYALILNFYRPGQAYPDKAPFQKITLNTPYLYSSLPVDADGEWRIEVVPATPSSPMVPFSISIFANNVNVGTFTDIARYNRLFVALYYDNSIYKVSISNIPTALALTGQVYMQVYGPTNTLDVNSAGLLSTTQNKFLNKSSQSLSITPPSSGGFYYIVLHASNAAQVATDPILISYSTSVYTCPFPPAIADYNEVYRGCGQPQTSSVYPCITFDQNLQTCTACAPRYVIDQIGNCNEDQTCPENQYFEYGSCLDVISNCINFQPIGGYCYQCEKGYILSNATIGTQVCLVIKVTCNSTQYNFNNKCFSNVDNCASLEKSTGICSSCLAGYKLLNNKCFIITVTITCSLGMLPQNGKCISIDSNCLFFNPNNTCMLCSKGYLKSNVTGFCVKIICQNRQFSQYGVCSNVSPYCATFDPIYGNCITCIPSYALNADGTCIQLYGEASGNQQGGTQVYLPCPNRYYLLNGACVQVSPNCLTFNNVSGKCLSCIDKTFFLQPNGQCILINSFCGFQQYFSNGACLPVSSTCGTYDLMTGFCLTCLDNLLLTSDGRCLYQQNCGARQYSSSDGSCEDVNPLCDQFDPSNGNCMTCVKDYEINPGGICCYKYNYLQPPAICQSLLSQNCTQSRPKFNNCLVCASGYDLINGYFGKCLPIK